MLQDRDSCDGTCCASGACTAECCAPTLTPEEVPGPEALVGERVGRLRRRVRYLVAATISYNVVEAVVAIAAGQVASSTALIGFGLDSAIEVGSAAAVAWQFSGRDPEARERLALRVIGLSFFGLAIYVTVSSVESLLTGHEPSSSLVGMVLAAASLIVMPGLSYAQRRAGRALGSRSAVADSKQTLLCTYLSGVLLLGLVANAVLGWWWADSVVGLVIAGLAVKEGRSAWVCIRCRNPCLRDRRRLFGWNVRLLTAGYSRSRPYAKAVCVSLRCVRATLHARAETAGRVPACTWTCSTARADGRPVQVTQSRERAQLRGRPTRHAGGRYLIAGRILWHRDGVVSVCTLPGMIGCSGAEKRIIRSQSRGSSAAAADAVRETSNTGERVDVVTRRLVHSCGQVCGYPVPRPVAPGRYREFRPRFERRERLRRRRLSRPPGQTCNGRGVNAGRVGSSG